MKSALKACQVGFLDNSFEHIRIPQRITPNSIGGIRFAQSSCTSVNDAVTNDFDTCNPEIWRSGKIEFLMHRYGAVNLRYIFLVSLGRNYDPVCSEADF